MEYTLIPKDKMHQYPVLIALYPDAAEYTVDGDTFCVFGDDDIPVPEIDKLSKQGFNHVFKAENKGLTTAQLKSKVNNRLKQKKTIKLSQSQGRYMWDKEWKPKQTED